MLYMIIATKPMINIIQRNQLNSYTIFTFSPANYLIHETIGKIVEIDRFFQLQTGPTITETHPCIPSCGAMSPISDVLGRQSPISQRSDISWAVCLAP